MTVKKLLWSLARIAMPGVGFALTSLGVYLLSLKDEYKHVTIPASFTIGFGLLTTLIGYHRNLRHIRKISQRGESQQNIQEFTVERPDSFPPTYEESQKRHISSSAAPETVMVVDSVDVAANLAPPLYSQDDTEAPDCTWSWERPPPYSQVDTEERGETPCPLNESRATSVAAL